MMAAAGRDDEPALDPEFHLVRLESVGSTNAEAARRAAEGAADGTLVWAGEQTAGRARRGREWRSPPGNLYCSLILRPAVPPRTAAQLSFVAALAVADALGAFAPEDAAVRVKWPNDVLLAGRKASGILLESMPGPDGLVDWVVVGTGINVASHPEDTEYPATSLAAAGVGAVDAGQVLEAYAHAIAVWRGRWEREGFGPIRAAWLGVATGLGDPVVVRLDHQSLEGWFAALDEDGALVLEMPGGVRRMIAAGDVFFPSG
jgi:BirA family biotin operon repressor/biotin-[acetyl-CoA-carboxylase] ligase